MAKREKFQIYLAGPITGCNDVQMHHWRDEVKAKYAKDFTFIDPTQRWEGNAIGEDKSPLEIVEADLRGIERADGMLVNMWRESIGTSIGMVHAHRAGKPVVVADPNHLDSQILAFYAEELEDNPLKAAAALRGLLRAERWSVLKAPGRDKERFDRRKLVKAIGAACAAADRNDVLLPPIVLPRVIDRLKHRKIGDQVTTSDIDKAVLRALRDLAEDGVHRKTVEGVREHWLAERDRRDDKSVLAAAKTKQLHGKIGVPIRTSMSKPHPTIWGKPVRQLSDVPSADARRVFEAIMRIPNITAVHLRRFGWKESRDRVSGVVMESPTANVLEGKVFDKGEKGTVQTFQVVVQANSEKARILEQCERALRGAGLWAG